MTAKVISPFDWMRIAGAGDRDIRKRHGPDAMPLKTADKPFSQRFRREDSVKAALQGDSGTAALLAAFGAEMNRQGSLRVGSNDFLNRLKGSKVQQLETTVSDRRHGTRAMPLFRFSCSARYRLGSCRPRCR